MGNVFDFPDLRPRDEERSLDFVAWLEYSQSSNLLVQVLKLWAKEDGEVIEGCLGLIDDQKPQKPG